MSQRLANLRQIMSREGLDLLLVGQPENRRYLSGFTGSDGVLLVTEDRAMLAADFRYYEQVKMQAPDFELVRVGTDMVASLAAQVRELGPKRLGFESHAVTVETYEKWRSAISDPEWVPTSKLVEELRVIKDAHELADLEEAVRIADQAMAHIQEWLRPGVTERELAWELEVYMRTHGAEKLSFDTILASGPNGAMCHAVPTDRPIQVGDPIIIDMGALYEGYCSDMTRSFCLGTASDQYRQVWDTVLQAQLATEEAVKPGMTGIQMDAVARDIIYGAGYEGKFGHGLGHGVGLAIHEPPRASRTSTDVLSAGMVLTVEPGIYVPGWGGVRLEDMVVLTDDGCRVLTQAPKVPVVEV